MATSLEDWIAGVLQLTYVDVVRVTRGEVECELSVPIVLRPDGPYVVELKGEQVWHGPRLTLKTRLAVR
jgi:hypothetical protein